MSRPRTLALRGPIDGSLRTYLLGPGLNRIGSRLDGDVVLAAAGVSRRHALLWVEADRLGLEDLGSKNGTFRNGERVESTPIEVGDRLGFGPQALHLLELDAADGRLAIPLSPQAGASPAPSESTRGPQGAVVAQDAVSLAWLGGFVERLASPSGALAWLVDELAASGAALVEESTEGRTVVLACAGELPPEPGACLRIADESRPGRCLLVWGDLANRESLQPLLGLLVRLLELPPPPAARAERAALSLPDGWLPGRSPAMRLLLRQMEAVAASELPILILGETGVGKEGVARALHASSPRHRGPFVAVSCAAIPRDLLEAELFGVGRGVATGVAPRPGKLREADGGTVFLDEIGDMAAELQAKLLRALQEREVQPLGGAAGKVDVRLLAATNSDLDKRLEEGSFRADLFYRLAGHVLRVPPLRERRQDIPELVEHFLRRASWEAGTSIRGVTFGALRRLVERPWPGNVRQLEHEIRRLVWLAKDSEALVAETLELAGDSAGAAEPLANELDLAALEQKAIAEALRRCNGNQSRAAELLGITRTALYRRMRHLPTSPD